MTDKVNFLPPEPIKLIDEDTESDELTRPFISNESNNFDTISNISMSNIGIKKIIISDCTIVTGDNGTKFAVWKMTLILKSDPTSTMNGGPPLIQLYKRYSDFERFRSKLLIKIREVRPDLRNLVPELPPVIPWYKSWDYDHLNFDKKWLAKRRIGLERFMSQVVSNSQITELASDELKKFLET
ncbi:Ypt35p NDAI_0C01680 [Naumovozyma dairenensis CBS 421]|uniref:Endosomal/vacuolar adapter protein YPT35 n=1 Tax=Naumovozyma dairenensis (strain ATCC 10597 / BCRC 20456 / CBS 421 / NBRC 0211 / NRRL Y-12639) TaxID=1071378 RepID=G0W7R8_NAUDC|nr:hypothetical protein NDAI_0C01680 [Naumovozyma dairenensis CBS 421]CCD23829.1 hypothetical protein NDAI_0C01680 [Naumovozyma dairenensis CBS 421]